ncbi:hypothetical protein [Bacillus sp. REN3]|uniref:hypothetical protein n=1 Tax=Bacillus sp. REN3 TaxID=2802440 RepID=UPI001AED2D1B|nr:hypothetical protein [Bacillus sp. REN3]
MYGYRNPYGPQDQRFGFGLPFLGGLAGGLLGTALLAPRPFYGYPGYGVPCCPPGLGYPGYGYPGYAGYPGYPY